MDDEIKTQAVVDPVDAEKGPGAAEQLKQVQEEVKNGTAPAAMPNGVQPQAAATPAKPLAAKGVPRGRRSRSSVVEDLKEFQIQVKTFKPEDLFIPIISVIILALLTIFVYIPMVNSAVQFRKDRKDIESKVTKLTNLDQSLDRVDVGALQRDLGAVRKVIPFSLQVTDFLLYVDNLSVQKKLDSKEILAGDVQIRSSGEERGVDPVVRGVSGPLRYTGDLADITDFLDELQNTSPFIVSTDEVELRKLAAKEGEKESWEVAIIVTGYYLNKNSIPEVNIYSNYVPYSQYSSIVDILKDKADQLEN